MPGFESKLSTLEGSRLRVALYSHDTMGLGHFRRNLLIAQALANSWLKPDLLLIAGTPEATNYSLPPNTEVLTVPPVYKDMNGEYTSTYLNVPLSQLIDMRARTIKLAVEKFRPHVFIVDKVPRGVLGELELTLSELKRNVSSQCVLGLRDILDEPSVVLKEWNEANNFDAIRRLYNAIWVYGDPTIYDTAREYSFPSDIAEMVYYTGYQDQLLRLRYSNSDEQAVQRVLSDGPFVLCLVGGGQDGSLVAENFAKCSFPEGCRGVILSGPYLPMTTMKRIREAASKNSRLTVLGFVRETGRLLSKAERLVAMGGYNTICEVLSFEKPALIVPRMVPRLEQYIRARRMQKRELIDLLKMEDVSSEAICKWLSSEPKKPPVRDRVDLNGLVRIPELLMDLISPLETLKEAHGGR